MATETPTVELSEYVAVVRRRIGLIVLCVAVLALAAVAYSLTRPAVYSSTAAVTIPGAPPSPEGNRAADPPDIETEVVVMSSGVVAERAAEEIPGEADIRELRRRLTVSTPTDARVIVVTYAAPSAETAQEGAQGFAEAYIQQKRSERQRSIDNRTLRLERRVETLDLRISDTAASFEGADPDSEQAIEAEQLLTSLQDARSQVEGDLNETRAEDIDAGQIITPARLPGSPQPRNLVRTVAAGIALGMLIGLGAAFVRERLDTRIQSASDVERALRTSVLGTIPRFPDRLSKAGTTLVTVHEPNGAAADAFRRLRTSTTLACRASGAQTIGVTGSVDGEGTTTVAANLAVALAQGGQRALLLSADVRSGRLGDLFDLERGPGLTDLLTGTTTLNQVLHRVGELDIITEGRPTTSATDLLTSAQTGDLIRSLRDRYDLVIVDTAPVLQVADALALAPSVDGFLVVTSPGVVTSPEVSDTRTELLLSGATLLGAIVNRDTGGGRRRIRPVRARRAARTVPGRGTLRTP